MRSLSLLVWCCFQAAGGLQWPELGSINEGQERKSSSEKKSLIWIVSRHVHLYITFPTGPSAHPAIVQINWSTFSESKVQTVMLWPQKHRLQTIPGSPGAYWSGLYASFALDVSQADLVNWALLDHRPDLLQPQLPHPHQGHHFPL